MRRLDREVGPLSFLGIRWQLPVLEKATDCGDALEDGGKSGHFPDGVGGDRRRILGPR
jgi:hypothetical protein